MFPRAAVVTVLLLIGLVVSSSRDISEIPACRVQLIGSERFPGIATPEQPICLQAFRWHTATPSD